VLVDDEELGVHAVAGLSSEADRHRPFGPVVLRRALGASRALHDWHLRQDRRRLTIRLHGPAGEPLVEWELAGALPTKWSAPDLNASSSDVAIEELELVHEGLEWKERPMKESPCRP
jgi:phage tail-like protein